MKKGWKIFWSIVIGVPILAALFALVIWGAQFERSRIRIFIDVDIPTPYRYIPAEGKPWKRAWGLLGNRQLWRDFGYLLALSIVLSIVYAAKSVRLQNRFNRLGVLEGRELDEIVRTAGPPNHRTKLGETARCWNGDGSASTSP